MMYSNPPYYLTPPVQDLSTTTPHVTPLLTPSEPGCNPLLTGSRQVTDRVKGACQGIEQFIKK